MGRGSHAHKESILFTEIEVPSDLEAVSQWNMAKML